MSYILCGLINVMINTLVFLKRKFNMPAWIDSALTWATAFLLILLTPVITGLLIWIAFKILQGAIAMIVEFWPMIFMALKTVFGFIWKAVPYVAVAYIAIEQYRTSHNLEVLRRGIEKLRNEKFPDY